MKKLNIAKSFQDRKFKYGGLATLITAVALAILLVINLLAGQLNLKIDLTKNKLYSLSTQTYAIINNLKNDVKIYAFYESGKEDPTFTAIINKYGAGAGKKITVEYKDPIKYPQFAQKYVKTGETMQGGSLIVESGSKFKLINPADLVNYNYDSSGRPTPDSLAVEQQVTSAILYVTTDKSPVIYNLTGHGEGTISADIIKQIDTENYTVKELNLMLKDSQISAGSSLLVVSPKKDITAEEAGKIKDFLSKGGKAVFLMDVSVGGNMPNFESILAGYGIGLQQAILVEGDPSRSANNPIYLIPTMGNHEIVSSLIKNRIPVLIPGGQGIELQNVKKDSVTIEPVLTTSNNSWGKKNLSATTSEKETGDLQGPFNVAVAITDKLSNTPDNDTRIVVVGNSLFANTEFAPNGGNIDFLMNSINWVQNKKDFISILPRSLNTGKLTINGLQQLLFSGIVVVVIPAFIIIWGISVLLRRKRQ